MSFFKNQVRKILQKTQDFLLAEGDSLDKLSNLQERRSLGRFGNQTTQLNQDNITLKSPLSQNNKKLSTIEVIDYRDNSKSTYEFNNLNHSTFSNKNESVHLKKKKLQEPQIKSKTQDEMNTTSEKARILDKSNLKTKKDLTIDISSFSENQDNQDFTKLESDENYKKLEYQIQDKVQNLATFNEKKEFVSKEDLQRKYFCDNTVPKKDSNLQTFEEVDNSLESNFSENGISSNDNTIPKKDSNLQTFEEVDNSLESNFSENGISSNDNTIPKKDSNLQTFEEVDNSLESNFSKNETFSNDDFISKQSVVQKLEIEKSSKMNKYEIPIEFLKYSSNIRNNNEIVQETNETSKKIEETIKEYGIDCEVIHIQRGPIITRYEIELPKGMKLNKLTSLEGELKVHLAALSVRIAPVIGKSTIGIEIPNKNRESLLLGDILRKYPSFFDRKDLSIPIGKDIAGKDRFIDLTKLPHLLVAGATGSGKSVCLNSMLSSLIYKMSPSDIQMVIIDPKMVELTLYQDIPHLMMPVITNPKHALKALNYLILEMEKRYQILSELKCRNLIDYNQKVELSYENTYIAKKYKKFSYILIFIDELSDLMMVTGKELEDAITRITQKARAIGIHMVMATQRPSVDVITGLIKANCPARIAFSVAQKTDSQTILDQTGAETLLGQGDFLYRSPIASGLERIQSPYISEDEIEKIVAYSKKYSKPNYQIDFENEQDDFSSEISDKDESLVREAWKVIKRDKKATGSHLQRKLSIGYPRAAKIIDILEERGFIGPENGLKSRARDIIK